MQEDQEKFCTLCMDQSSTDCPRCAQRKKMLMVPWLSTHQLPRRHQASKFQACSAVLQIYPLLQTLQVAQALLQRRAMYAWVAAERATSTIKHERQRERRLWKLRIA